MKVVQTYRFLPILILLMAMISGCVDEQKSFHTSSESVFISFISLGGREIKPPDFMSQPDDTANNNEVTSISAYSTFKKKVNKAEFILNKSRRP